MSTETITDTGCGCDPSCCTDGEPDDGCCDETCCEAAAPDDKAPAMACC